MQTPDSSVVHARVNDALDLVNVIAIQIASAIRSVEYEELVAFGREGLVSAALRFDPARGTSFRTYASYRVRGAIYDGVRRAAPMPRRTYDRVFAMERASSLGEGNADEAFSDEPVPDGGDAAVEPELRSHGADVATAASLALVSHRLRQELAMHSQEPGSSPEQAVLRAELVVILRQSLLSLPPNEWEIIRRHYFEDQTLEEIAASVKISGSWASRLHTRAIAFLTKQVRRTA